MGAGSALRLRLERRRWQLRGVRKGRDLTVVADRSGMVGPGAVLLFSTVRNEKPRLPYFLKYYREMGIEHFFVVDNGSTDGSAELLAGEPDVSLWQTVTSYKRSRFGTDWLNFLKFRFGHGHWTLTVDADEFLVFPFCDTRPIPALCDWLDQSGLRVLGTLLLDMYPKGPPEAVAYAPGQNPFEIAPWFDTGNYTVLRNKKYGNLWIQGGPRARVYFADAPDQSPSLNKIPLVKWDRRYVHVSSTHMLLPRGLNQVYDVAGGEKATGCLLHAKFLDSFPEKAAEEITRRQHFARGREYDAYHLKEHGHNGLWCEWSERYIDWRQLELLGLMSKGNWA
ncbi:MAG: glycosyltransferase family 2 protein [Silicimonas sp.]|nr:glycosyltransferase family 2 protein [Silicimonas sp.]